jgi:hypothetical protein
MATVDQEIREHDVVTLRRQIGSWPSGREGTVVAEQGAWKLSEIADEQGSMLDLISVLDADLDVIWKVDGRS